MALVSCDFFSESLAVGCSMTVVLPQRTTAQIGVESAAPARDGTPLLYLLHGLSDDHGIWQRQTSIERYAAPLGLAVVMPMVHRSWYADEAQGHAYWTFLTEELPRLVPSFFQVSTRREDTYVAGLSMGGYGALKWAIREPWRFAGAASMSGALDVAALAAEPERHRMFAHVYPGGVPTAGDDLFALLRDADVAALPPMHVSCGTEDFLVDANERFVAEAERAGVDLTTRWRPGDHEWGFWDEEIQTVLRWLPGLAGESA